MELRHLRYFLAVGEELHFTRAAARLGISQPPLSQQIQNLEREIGTPLFQRLPHGVALTAAGRRLMREAREIIVHTERAIGNARRTAQGELGTIRIGFTASASFHPFVTGALRDYRGAFPDVGIELFEDNTTAQLSRLAERRTDAAFVRATLDESKSFNALPLFEEEMVVVLPEDHRLARKRAVRLAELAGELFILYPRRNGAALHDAIVTACQAVGFSPRVGQEAPQMASTVTLVAAGIGISIVPASMRQLRALGVSYRRIEGVAPHAPMSLISVAGENTALTAQFVELVARRHLPQQGASHPLPAPRPSAVAHDHGLQRRKAV